MRKLIDPLVLGLLMFLIGIAYYAFRFSVEAGMFLLLVYAALWAMVIMAIRGSVRGDELRKRAREAKEKGKKYHRFSVTIMLLAFGPFALVLLALAVRLALTLRWH